jgi:hypothetical protein
VTGPVIPRSFVRGLVIPRSFVRVGRRGIRRIAPPLALLSVCLSAGAQPPDVLSSAHEAAIRAYAAGDRESAVSAVASWPEALVREQERALGAAGPLQFQGVLLYPTFGEAVSLGAGKPLAFLFTLRPGDRPLPEARVELLSGDAVVRGADVPWPASDATGQLRVVSGLPIEGLAAGAYTLRLTLSDGLSLESRSAEVTLAP